MKLRVLIIAAIAAIGVIAGVLVTAAGASASTAPCAGYTYRNKIAVKYSEYNVTQKTVGYIYWYERSVPHHPNQVCAVTRPLSTYLGKTFWLSVMIKSSPSGMTRDGGNYHQYAGPVTVYRTSTVYVWGEVGIVTSTGRQLYEVGGPTGVRI